MKGVKAKWGWMREAEFLSLVRESGTYRDTRHRPPSPRLSISCDSIRVQAIALVSRGTTAPSESSHGTARYYCSTKLGS